MMNKSKIEWCTHSWNPVTGCEKGCDYCYARKLADRIYTHKFKPHFYEDRLEDPRKERNPCRIFVSSMGDLFGKWVPDEWILKVLQACASDDRHTYYFLTKNPLRYFQPEIKPYFERNYNFWRGFSAPTGHDYYMDWGLFMPNPLPSTFVSIEPMHDGTHVLDCFKMGKVPRWVIVGAQTKPNRFPSPKWIANIRQQCELFNIALFEKNNLIELDLPGGLIQEVPENPINPQMSFFDE